MYQALLSRRYLFRRVIPILAMLSVALCTAMVIIVLSVMGGFLEMITKAGRAQVGDVAVQAFLQGFSNYEDLRAELLQLPEVASATAVIEGFGLIKLPSGDTQGVQLLGIDGAGFDRVTGYAAALFWRVLTAEEEAVLDPADLRAAENTFITDDPALKKRYLAILAEQGLTLETRAGLPGAVLGIEINPFNERLKLHSYDVQGPPMPGQSVTISVIPITDEGGFVQAVSQSFEVVNEFSVGRYDIDSSQVFLPFAVLQKMLKMQPMALRGLPLRDATGAPVRDEFDELVYETASRPGRASRLLIRAAEGVAAAELKVKVQAVIQAGQATQVDWRFLSVKTWEEQIAGFIGAVKKETALVTTLFSIISLVSVFLVLAIFWTIVQQKTRDIGTLRAVGASRLGIMWMFLRYGLIIGVCGAVLGALLAYAIVWNINPIHEFVGQVTKVYIWDPKVYYFNELPNEINPLNALIIMSGGALFAVLGALIPSIRAAYVDPVAALRYE